MSNEILMKQAQQIHDLKKVLRQKNKTIKALKESLARTEKAYNNVVKDMYCDICRTEFLNCNC